jgi:hypothetical protein
MALGTPAISPMATPATAPGSQILPSLDLFRPFRRPAGHHTPASPTKLLGVSDDRGEVGYAAFLPAFTPYSRRSFRFFCVCKESLVHR